MNKLYVILLLSLSMLACTPGVEVEAALNGELQTTVGAQLSADAWNTSTQSVLRLQLREGTYPLRLSVDGAARVAGSIGESDWDASFELERYYVKASLSQFDLNVGRQQISWGLGYAWAPTDLFNPPNPQDPQGRRQGVDALVIQMPSGPLNYWSAVFAHKAEQSSITAADAPWQYALRRHANTNGVDWTILAIRNDELTVAGGDMKIDYGPSWSAEVAYFMPDSAKSRWEGVFGADYSWLDGRLVWRGEYLYNSAGATDKSQYDYAKLQLGDIKYPARHYVFNQLSGQVDMFTSVSASALANLVDGSSILILAGQTLLSGDWRVALSLTAPLGETGDEYALGAKLMARAQVQYSF